MQTARQHQECGSWTSTKKLEIEKEANIPTSEASLQQSPTSITDHFCENSQQLKVINYFWKTAPSQIFGWALNTPK